LAKRPLANRSLTEQFAGREVRKKYLLLTDREPPEHEFTAKSKIIRAGERYVSGAHGEAAETRFGVPASAGSPSGLKAGLCTMEGRATHWTDASDPRSCCRAWLPHFRRCALRRHSFPAGLSARGGVVLQASRHQRPVTFTAPVDFTGDSRATLRTAIIELELTDAFRVIHGASDGWPGWYVEQLGLMRLAQSEAILSAEQRQWLESRAGVVTRRFCRGRCDARPPAETSPQLVSGPAAPERFVIRENGVKFEMSFTEGYSVGLFLDQRDNRRPLPDRPHRRGL
jgi:hypothetical protein